MGTSEHPIVAVCTPIFERPEPCFTQSLRVSQSMTGFHFYFEITGYPADYARREMTKMALDIPDVTHVAFVDSDQSFAPDTFVRLVLHDKPIVSGLIFARRHPFEPMIYRNKKPIFDYPSHELIEVDSCGGGACLIKREVLESVQAKYGDTWWNGSSELSGDEAFIHRVADCGFKVYCDTSVRFGHMAHLLVDEDFARKNGGWCAR